jgi:hypothetical protein
LSLPQKTWKKPHLTLLAKATKSRGKLLTVVLSLNSRLPKAKEVYAEVFWIKDQIEEAVADSLDFTKALIEELA